MELNTKLAAIDFMRTHFSLELNCKIIHVDIFVDEFINETDVTQFFFQSFSRFKEISNDGDLHGKLVVVEEAQQVCFWSIDREGLRLPNCEVFQGGYLVDDEEDEDEDDQGDLIESIDDDASEGQFVWEHFGNCFFQFFATSMCWNAVNGGWPFSGMTKLRKNEIQQIAEEFALCELGKNKSGLTIYSGGNDSIIAVDVSREVFVATRTREVWQDLMQKIPRLSLYDE